jgi:hypothetical protein
VIHPINLYFFVKQAPVWTESPNHHCCTIATGTVGAGVVVVDHFGANYLVDHEGAKFLLTMLWPKLMLTTP